MTFQVSNFKETSQKVLWKLFWTKKEVKFCFDLTQFTYDPLTKESNFPVKFSISLESLKLVFETFRTESETNSFFASTQLTYNPYKIVRNF